MILGGGGDFDDLMKYMVGSFFGEVWFCLGLDLKIWFMIIFMVLIVLGCELELCIYLCGVYNIGILFDIIEEMMLYFVYYGGWFVVVSGQCIVREVYVELDKD